MKELLYTGLVLLLAAILILLLFSMFSPAASSKPSAPKQKQEALYQLPPVFESFFTV
jgi:hypothetical protein